jgi:predicted membrane GTPase involved in stress response
MANTTKEITMTQDHASATQKPRLDDLLTTMGITREQLMEMTAGDLFAAATRWQDAATLAAEAQRFASPVDRLFDRSSTYSTTR